VPKILNLLLSVGIVLSLLACASGRAKDEAVTSVQGYVNAKASGVVILDVNDTETRANKGVVPGAVMLTAYDSYAFSELPVDKKTTLIFYCYNTLCPASGLAADRAIDAGYTDVRVMKAGIVGWKDAAEKAQKLSVASNQSAK
jgi:rhodanese-related sulfurtransferase